MLPTFKIEGVLLFEIFFKYKRIFDIRSGKTFKPWTKFINEYNKVAEQIISFIEKLCYHRTIWVPLNWLTPNYTN